ncbi:MAG: hypothetical protein OEZ68_18910 [Gammaproteobacteria bacterium]|nr:hypothetical protein [Gammaproteobacteria bacterium]MDH5802878.1 hypothetical protein [Gammaproteobacteria bacterium]
MPKATTKPVVKFGALEKSIDSSLETLKNMYDGGSAAVSVRSKEKQKLLSDSKRLSKKKNTLLKKKRTAATKLKKAPGVETRKALSLIEKELITVSKSLAKTNLEKTKVAEELAGLKLNVKRVTAYLKGVAIADKALSKANKTKAKSTTPSMAA